MINEQLYGLIGYPLSHSFSPSYFKRKFERENINADYELFPIDNISNFTELTSELSNLKGLNVTIPYKESIMRYLDEIDDTAKAVGAVNCIKISDGKKSGHNTDVIGFRKSLLPLLQSHHTKALVLGTGGGAQAVSYVLKEMSIDHSLVSRKGIDGTINYEGITPEIIASNTIIINTTPLGMYPNIESFPQIPYDSISERHLLYDLVYNPEETTFLSKGKAQGAVTKNGLEMLELQAEAAWNIWN